MPAAKQPNEVTLVAAGDVFFARGVGRQIDKHGRQYPFDKVRKVIKDADIAFCNLECPLSKRGVPQHRKFLFRCDPLYAGMLASNGFDVASLANNHTLDYGRDALLDTRAAITKAGMTAVGAGVNRRDALRLQIVRKNGLRIGFLAYTDVPNAGVVRLSGKPTVAGVNADELPGEVKAAKSKCDILAVSFHWGVEYMKRPTERQQMLAHLAVDNGADVIIGHHPHVLQPVDIYKSKPIVYSAGAFIWDAKIFGADKSAVYVIKLRKSSARLVKVIPVKIEKCQPHLIIPKAAR